MYVSTQFINLSPTPTFFGGRDYILGQQVSRVSGYEQGFGTLSTQRVNLESSQGRLNPRMVGIGLALKQYCIILYFTVLYVSCRGKNGDKIYTTCSPNIGQSNQGGLTLGGVFSLNQLSLKFQLWSYFYTVCT